MLVSAQNVLSAHRACLSARCAGRVDAVEMWAAMRYTRPNSSTWVFISHTGKGHYKSNEMN